MAPRWCSWGRIRPTRRRARSRRCCRTTSSRAAEWTGQWTDTSRRSWRCWPPSAARRATRCWPIRPTSMISRSRRRGGHNGACRTELMRGWRLTHRGRRHGGCRHCGSSIALLREIQRRSPHYSSPRLPRLPKPGRAGGGGTPDAAGRIPGQRGAMARAALKSSLPGCGYRSCWRCRAVRWRGTRLCC